MNARRILSTSAVATAAVLLSIGVQTLAYTAPQSAPTTIDADAPLNVGAGLQIKTGTLTLNSGGGSAIGLTVSKDLKVIGGNLKVVDMAGLGYGLIASRICFGTSSGADITYVATDCKTAWPNTTGFISTDATAQTKAGDLTLNPGSLIVTAGKIKVGTGTFTPAAAGLGVFGEFKFDNGTAAANEVLTATAAGGNSTWKNPVTELGLQKAISACTNAGSAITAINPTTGAVTCGPVMRAGAYYESAERTLHTVSISPAMPDASYVILITYGTSGGSNSNDCYQTQILTDTQTASGFEFKTPDYCSSVTYNWMAIDR